MTNIFKNSVTVFGIQIASRGLAFLSFVYIARLLGVGSIGDYAYIISLCALLTLFVEFGTSQFLVKKVAADGPSGCSIDVLNIVVLKAIQFLLGLGILLVVEYETMVRHFQVLNLTLCYVIFEGIAQVGISILNGRKQFIRANKLLFFYETGRSLLLLALLFFLKDVRLIPVVYISAALIYALVVSFVVFGKKLSLVNIRLLLPGLTGPSVLFYYRNTYLFFVSAIAYQLYFRIDMILLKRLSTPYELGIYSTAYKFFEVFLFVPAILSGIIFPQAAHLFKNGLLARLKQFLRDLQLQTVALVSSIVLLLIIFSDLIIHVFFGPTFLAAVPIMQILFLTSFLYCFNFIYPVLFNSTGNERYTIYIFLIGFLLNFGLNYFFLPLYGATAAAIINLVTECIVTALYYEFLRRRSLQILNPKALALVGCCILLSCLRMYLVNWIDLIPLNLVVFSTFVSIVFLLCRKNFSPKLILNARQ